LRPATAAPRPLIFRRTGTRCGRTDWAGALCVRPRTWQASARALKTGTLRGPHWDRTFRPSLITSWTNGRVGNAVRPMRQWRPSAWRFRTTPKTFCLAAPRPGGLARNDPAPKNLCIAGRRSARGLAFPPNGPGRALVRLRECSGIQPAAGDDTAFFGDPPPPITAYLQS